MSAPIMQYGLYLEITFLNEEGEKVILKFENSKRVSSLSLQKVKDVFQNLLDLNEWRDNQGKLIKSVYTANFIEQAIWKNELTEN